MNNVDMDRVNREGWSGARVVSLALASVATLALVCCACGVIALIVLGR